MLERLDQKQLPCYLGTQNPRNIPIYEGYGFRVVEESKIPDTNVSHYAMLRKNLLKPTTRRQDHENGTSFKSRIS
jgi:hypothetical protein